jgi:hypothetical protein
MKATLLFALASAGLIGAAWLLLASVFPEPEAGRALATSAGLAFLVQLLGFVIARKLSRRVGSGGRDVMIGWGLGSILRLLTLFIYGLAVVKPTGMPMTPALVSLALFFFVTMLVEPILLQL